LFRVNPGCFRIGFGFSILLFFISFFLTLDVVLYPCALSVFFEKIPLVCYRPFCFPFRFSFGLPYLCVPFSGVLMFTSPETPLFGDFFP